MNQPGQEKTRVLADADEERLASEGLARLEAGGLLLVPTETVYGVVARADAPAALERLHALKGERGDKPFARIVADLAAVEASGVQLPPQARRLAQRYWPGPLTLVLDDEAGGTVGFRVPGSSFARRLAAGPYPLVATSANASGEEPPVTWEAAVAAVGDAVDLAFDGGDAQLRAPSSVVRVRGTGEAQLLREGFLGLPAIERVLLRRIVFVCTGNTCRSPMAEVLFQARLARALGVELEALAGLGWQVASAGVAAGLGGPAARNAQQVMAEQGLDLSGHRSQPLDPDFAEGAERIVALTPSHAAGILGRWPELADAVELLDPRGVPDPIGGDLATYRRCAQHIAARLDLLLETLDLRGEAPGGGPPSEAPSGVVPSGETASLELCFPTPEQVPADLRLDPGTLDGERYLVDGRLLRWEGPSTPVPSPILQRTPTGLRPRILGHTALLDAEVGLAALAAAERAWDLGRGAWPQATLGERRARLSAFRADLAQVGEEIARRILWEVAKPLPMAEEEVARTLRYLDQTLEALRLRERAEQGVLREGGVVVRAQRAPLGVCLCLGPFNYPLNESLATVVPALAMGNTVVLKLPRVGMLSAQPLLPLFAKHFPPGVVNVISGEGEELVGPLMRSGRVDVLAFIGSSRVARLLEEQHPDPHRLTSILGMDAKNAGVVLPSADLERILPAALEGALAFNGQRCTALKVFFVHRSRAEDFATRLAAAVDELPLGMPWEEGVRITPLAEAERPEFLEQLLADARSHGARLLTPGGGRRAGSLVSPAVLYPVSSAADLFRVEQFGPLVPIVPFDEPSEVHEAIARGPFGQQASVFGEDLAELRPMVAGLSRLVCRVNLNTLCRRGPDCLPFTGRKRSARGVLSVEDALHSFSLPSLLAGGEGPDEGLFRRVLAGEPAGAETQPEPYPGRIP